MSALQEAGSPSSRSRSSMRVNQRASRRMSSAKLMGLSSGVVLRDGQLVADLIAQFFQPVGVALTQHVFDAGALLAMESVRLIVALQPIDDAIGAVRAIILVDVKVRPQTVRPLRIKQRIRRVRAFSVSSRRVARY
eukprot:4469522-Pleurochrysis_carterae.AAC.6